MPDDTTDVTNDQVSDATTDDVDPTPQDAPSQDQVSADDAFDKDRAMATIRKLREEAKAATREIKELAVLRAEKKANDEAKLSEQERLTKRASDLERELEAERKASAEMRNRNEVQRQAAKLNIIDPEAAEKLIDWSQVEYDDAGKPTNLADVLADLVEAKPYLVPNPRLDSQSRQPSGNAGNPATRTAAPGTRRYTAQDIANRSFYLANKADIDLAMRQGRIDA